MPRRNLRPACDDSTRSTPWEIALCYRRRMSLTTNRKAALIGVLLLTAQLLLIALLAWPCGVPVKNWIAFIPIAAALALGIWTLCFNRPGNFNFRPEVKRNARLIVTGPYAWIRHPMYTGIFLFGVGALLVYPTWTKLVCWLLLALVLRAKATREEQALQARFPEYRDYSARIGRFLPKMKTA
jgi:protein-S-isoprenylcysteine O-methyltransferase Ste14